MDEDEKYLEFDDVYYQFTRPVTTRRKPSPSKLTLATMHHYLKERDKEARFGWMTWDGPGPRNINVHLFTGAVYSYHVAGLFSASEAMDLILELKSLGAEGEGFESIAERLLETLRKERAGEDGGV